jgi:riboflavin kinase/FMN adenylyltransferase
MSPARIFRSLEEIPPDFGPTIVSVGNFDGVHCAHQAVLREVVMRARERGVKALAVTFEPHPLQVLKPEAAPKLLTPAPQKLDLLAQTGLDAVLVIPFSKDFSRTSAADFIAEVLSKQVRALEVHEGANFRFGHGAKGDVAELQKLAAKFGFTAKIYDELRIRGELVSSSRIRQILQAGNVSRARVLLGRPFSIQAKPTSGRGLGGKYTVPTINLGRYEELIPANGVYITRTRVAGQGYDSVTNVGMRPTFGEAAFAIETHLLDTTTIEIDRQQEIEVCFLKRLRDERKFESSIALREQIARDVSRARRFFRLALLRAQVAS